MRVDRISRLLLEFNPREIFNVKFLTADSLHNQTAQKERLREIENCWLPEI